MARLKPGLISLLTLAAATAIWTANSIAQPLLTGEVYSRKAQDIIVPLTTNWKATISMMVEEGQLVQAGDVVVEFDGSEASRQLEQQRESMLAETKSR